MDNLKNEEFFFLPFQYKYKNRDERSIYLDGNEDWTFPKELDTRYLFKFMTDKMNPANKNECQCCHYLLNSESEYSNKILEKSYSCKEDKGESNHNFKLRQIHLFLFTSGVGLIAFQTRFEDNNALMIARGAYELKKVNRTQYWCVDEDEPMSLLELAKKSLTITIPNISFIFFPHSNEDEERANMLLYIEADTNNNYEMELFALANCYGTGFPFDSEIENKKGEWLYKASPDVFWGITDEAIACRTLIEEVNRDFRQNEFFKNVIGTYMFMYVLLLHQKYVLYNFLTEIGIEANNTEKKLENYKERLAQFQTNFMFNVITEVPQYQNVYDRVTKAFRIKELFADVEGPVLRLATIRKEQNDVKIEKHEKSMDRILFALAIIGVISALCDYTQLANALKKIVDDAPILNNTLSVIQISGILLILMLLIYILIVSPIKQKINERRKQFGN